MGPDTNEQKWGGIYVLPEQDALIEKLYYENFRKLTLYAMSVVKNEDRAKDIVQDTFHEAIKHIDQLMTHENPAGWLMVTTKYKIQESERSRNRYLLRFLSLDTDVTEAQLSRHQETIEDHIANVPFPFEKIEQALTPDEFKLLTRFVFDKASHLTIAQEFGISVYASQKRLERIRKKLYETFPERAPKKKKL